MTPPLTSDELGLLRAINTPTLANAIERLGVRGRDEGFSQPTIKCVFPELGAVVGYAVTATIRSATAPTQPPSPKPYWDHIARYPLPRIVVVQDLDQPPAGAWWGEVNANIHRALGCIGAVTDGSVRDLEEVRALGFQFHASAVAVSHCWAHLEEFDQPVKVGGMSVRPGDLVHADRHGAIVIPPEHARNVLAAAGEVERYERPMLQLCKSQEFSTAKLEELMRRKTG